MYWNEVIKLGEEKEVYEDFEYIKTYDFHQVFCNEVSIKQSEFYYANQQGLRPEVAFAIRREEYNGETVFEWNDKRYYLVRTFANQRNGTVEVYLSSDINVLNEYGGGKDD